ncbi:MAG: hypothetical protein B6D45_04400, partial [Ignavibacteriales bacterium UTCHB3]
PTEGLTPDDVIFSSDRLGGEYSGVYNIFNIKISTGEITPVTATKSNFGKPVLVADSKGAVQGREAEVSERESQGSGTTPTTQNVVNKKLIVLNDADGVNNLYEIEVSGDKFSDTARNISDLYTGVQTSYSVDSTFAFFTSVDRMSFDIYKLDRKRVTKLPTVVSDRTRLQPPKPFPQLGGDAKKTIVQYKEDYTLDYAQSQIATDPVFGTRGGAVLSLSDLLGDDKYFILLFNTAETQSDFLESFNIDISRLNTKNRTNFGYGVFNYRGRRYDLREADEYYFEKSYGTYFLLQYPFSSFDRIETTISLANVNKDIIGFGSDQRSLLVTNSVAYVFDNSLWGPTGPLDGIRLRAQLGMTHDIRYGNENYYSFIFDYRHYLRLLYTTSLAFRGSIYWNEGTTSRRYIAGGSWDLRGYPRFGLRGQKFWITSAELRIPLADRIAVQLPFLGLSFSGLRGALFFDAGSLWDKEYKETLGSVGFGFRFNLFNLIVFRYDIGKKIEQNFTKFQDGWFYQFFFGWDF